MDALTKLQNSDLALDEVQSIDQNPAVVYLAGLGERSRRVQKQSLEVIANMLTGNPDILACNWAKLRYQHTQAIRSKLAEQYKPNTANRMLCALRGVLGSAFELEQMKAEHYQRAIRVKSVIGETLPAGRELSSGEISALLANCEKDTSPAGARDAALIALLYACGLRRAEVVSLNLEDYNAEKGTLRVLGKRSKERICYLLNGGSRAMDDWLAIRGNAPGALFWRVLKSGRLVNQRLTTQAIYNMLVKRGGLAGVKDFSPHDFRRTFVSDLLDAGADIATVAKMAGHASVITTARYDRRPEQAKQKAAQLLHVPYKGRKTN